LAFANSLLLVLGGLAVAVPVVLHFVMQPKPKPLAFPAIRFLVQSEAVSSRRLRIKHWLLLLARILVVGLLALALAGPSVAENAAAAWTNTGISGGLALVAGLMLAAVWSTRRTPVLLGGVGLVFLASMVWTVWSMIVALRPDPSRLLGNPEEPVTAILIVDTSPRMGYRRENRTHLDYAREEAAWVLSLLPPDSQISIIDSGDPESFFSVDLGAAERRLAGLEIVATQPGLGAALKSAGGLLKSSAHERREVYLLTDLGAAAWEGVQGGEELLPSGTGLFLIDVGTERPANLALANPAPEAVRLTGTSSLSIETNVTATGGGGERMVELRIEQPDPARPVIRDGQVLGPEKYWSVQQPVEVPENGSTAVTLRFEQSLPPGVHQGTITLLGSDALAADDQRFFTVSVEDRWQVLVLHGPGVNPGNISVTLAPPIFEVTTLAQNDSGTLDIGQFDAVILLDPGPWAETEWLRLGRFVEAGGGVAILPGANAQAGSGPDPAFTVPAARRLLGGQLTFPWRRPDGDLFLAPDNLAHSLFDEIRPVASTLAWNRFPVFLFWGLAPEFTTANQGAVLVRYTNGEPALFELKVGEGRVLVLTTPLTEVARPKGRPSWNSLFLGSPLPAWMLVRGMGLYLVQARSETLNLTVGQPARLRNDVRVYPGNWTMFSPDTRRPPAPLASSRGEIRYPFTGVPGQYRLKGAGDRPANRGFSVNLEDRATDLTRVTAAQLDELLGADNYKLTSNRADFERAQGTSRRGQEFYPVLLLVLAVLLALEFLLGARFYGRSSDSRAAADRPAGSAAQTTPARA
jgi:Aerotolerance regulator N-terminal